MLPDSHAVGFFVKDSLWRVSDPITSQIMCEPEPGSYQVSKPPSLNRLEPELAFQGPAPLHDVSVSWFLWVREKPILLAFYGSV